MSWSWKAAWVWNMFVCHACAGLFSCFWVQTSEKWIGWSRPIVSGSVIFVGLEWVISHELLSRLHWFYLAWGWKPRYAEIEPKRPTFFWIMAWSWNVWNLDSTYYCTYLYFVEGIPPSTLALNIVQWLCFQQVLSMSSARRQFLA